MIKNLNLYGKTELRKEEPLIDLSKVSNAQIKFYMTIVLILAILSLCIYSVAATPNPNMIFGV